VRSLKEAESVTAKQRKHIDEKRLNERYLKRHNVRSLLNEGTLSKVPESCLQSLLQYHPHAFK